MNSLAHNKYAGRLVMVLAAMTSLVLMAACGSGGGPTPPNTNGYTVSNLSGTYVISVSGTDANAQTESSFAIVGTMTTDGKGNITGGKVDINDPNIASTGGSGIFLGQGLSASTYSVSSDGRGKGSLITPQGTFGLDFVLTSTGHALITRFDSGGSGSGTMDLQGTASQSSLTSLAFSLSGSDSTGLPFGTVGALTLNSSGSITAGTQDFNDDGNSGVSGSAGLPLTGAVTVSGASGTARLTTSSGYGTLAFDVWVIDAAHLKLIETDATSGLTLSGDVFTQQTSFTAGQLVFTVGGVDSTKTNPFVAGGFVTTDVNGNLSAGVEDYNDNGTIGTSSPFTGTCNATAPFAGGRCHLALTGFSNGALQAFTFAAYPSSGGVLLLENDSLGLAQGTAYTQAATSFAASAGYGLNLSGLNLSSDGEVDDIAQFNAGPAATSLTAAANMVGVLDEGAVGSNPVTGVALSGVYVPDSPATGRGAISATTNGTINGGLTLEYYAVDSSTILFIEGDAGQVGLGTFELQSAATSSAAARPATAMVRPIVRFHGALRRK